MELKTTYSSNSINLAENSEIFSNEGDKESEIYSPFVMPTSDQSNVQKFRFFFCWPLAFLFYITIPNVQNKNWQKFYLLTFFMSLVWLSLFSYVMVWMITIIGYTFLIPDTIMGITFIAFGASIPDCFASLLVAKKGELTISANLFFLVQLY